MSIQMNLKNGLASIGQRKRRVALVSMVATALVLGSTGAAYADGKHDDDYKKKSHQATTNYTGPVETISVSEMLESNSWFSDKNYILEGHITKQLTNRTYLFSDGVDELIVKLKSDQVLSFSDKDKVRIKGEYEFELLSDSVFEVKKITLL